jgi:hypothetical protein
LLLRNRSAARRLTPTKPKEPVMSKRAWLFAALVSVALPAWADDDLKPAQEEAKEGFEKGIEDPLKAMNDKCGTKLKIAADWKNFDAAAWSGTSYTSYCQSVVDGVAKICERSAYKKIVAKKISGIACLFKGGSPQGPKDGSNDATLRSMSVDKGVFTYKMLKDAHSNISDNTVATFEKTFN